MRSTDFLRNPRRAMRAALLPPAVLLAAGIVIAALPSSGAIGPTAPAAPWQRQTYTAAVVATPSAFPPAAPDTANLVCDHYHRTVIQHPSSWTANAGAAGATLL